MVSIFSPYGAPLKHVCMKSQGPTTLIPKDYNEPARPVLPFLTANIPHNFEIFGIQLV